MAGVLLQEDATAGTETGATAPDEPVQVVAGRGGLVDVEAVAIFVDDLEKLEGLYQREMDVLRSAESVFAGNPTALRVPCHAVYAVPPALEFVAPQLGVLYAGDTITLPMLKVREPGGALFERGLDALHDVLARRIPDPDKLLGPRWVDHFRTLILASGGYVRDLLRLVRDVVRCRFGAVGAVSVDDPATVVERSIAMLRSVYGKSFRLEDLEWLKRIDADHDPGLLREDQLPRLARLFDNKIVLCYHNGSDWYGLHPCFRHSPVVARHMAAP